ncbi:MAG TPA: sugar-binding domain-containing protein [Bacillota bacterium]|nr:sugar-binding domain-containing protein [Bacillota bacterium]
MKTLIELQKKLYPDLLKIMQQRYSVLYSIDLFQPIGRRGLAENTNLTERIVRSEVDFLQEQGFIQVTAKGMYMTKEGKLLVDQLASFMSEITGLSGLERQLTSALPIEDCIVVPGDSDVHDWVKQEMGKACVSHLKTTLGPGQTIGVTGGTTMAAVAAMMVPLEMTEPPLFVPARGGLGEKAENQANTIVAEMARKAKGDYRLLYVPDPLSEASYQSMINEPSVKDILQLIKHSDVILHGIGDALTMAKRRKTTPEIIEKLRTNKAISEAFGYYFDADGNIVHKVRTIGIQLEDLASINHVITVAGGQSKAQAITSYFQDSKSDMLITDEAAAKAILRG